MAKRVRDDDDDADDAPKVPSDAYVGLIAVSTAALAVAAIFLFLDSGEIQAPPAPPQVVGGNGLLAQEAGAAAK